MAKLGIVSIVFALASSKGWPIHQIDVNNAFLHRHIDEEIYMITPKGYSKASLSQVCKLKSSLYDLKQASCQ